MPTFAFEATDQRGRKLVKEIQAESRQEAISKIRGMGYQPTRVQERAGGSKRAQAAAKPAAKKKTLVLGGVSQKELTLFTSQLSTLQDAGLPIVRSLRILEGQLKPCMLKNVLLEVAEDTEGGSTFSEALAKHGKVFDALYVNMVRAGEAGGVLDTILERLAMFMEKSLRLKKKIIGAMIYPIVIMLIAVFILGFIMVVVVPKFEKMFSEVGAQMPAVTQVLLSMSSTAANYWYMAIILPVVLYGGMKAVAANPTGRFLLDKMKLSAPVIGGIARKGIIARFTRTLGTLIASGVPILDALAIVREAVGNTVVSKAIDDVYGSIKEGESIAGPLAQSGIFDDIIINMISVGEETGELDKMLTKIADNYEDDVDTAVESMTSVLEPIMIIGMGGSVGFIVIALFMPMVELMKQNF